MIFTTYCDASGQQDEKTDAIAVLGLVVRVTRWQRFEREWQGVLDDYRVPYFHMREYAHSRGPFASWKGDEERRAAFCGQLIKVTKRAINKLFACGVWLADYHEVDAPERVLSSAVRRDSRGNPRAGG